MRKLLLAALIAVLVIIYLYAQEKSAFTSIYIGETSVKALVADSYSERAQGLSGRKSLEDGEGMLFIFNEPGDYGFWMKDMNFAIDIIWIDENLKVLGVEKAVEPSTYPTVFHPPSPVLCVLEVPAGFSDTTDLKLGESLSIGQ